MLEKTLKSYLVTITHYTIIYKKFIAKNTRVQNYAAKIIKKKRKLEHITSILKICIGCQLQTELHLKVLVIVTTFKCLNGHTPE